AAPPRTRTRLRLRRRAGRARRDGGDLLLPLVRHARPRRRLAALEPERPRAPRRRLLALLPGGRAVLERPAVRGKAADVPDRRGRGGRGRRLLVGPRLARGPAAAARHRGPRDPPPPVGRASEGLRWHLARAEV